MNRKTLRAPVTYVQPTFGYRAILCAAALIAATAEAPPAAAQVSGGLATSLPEQRHRPHAGMLRFPDVSATHIVFVYADDLWLAPREGGIATPLASPPGPELLPRFSPDGKQVAFVGNYEGNRDLHVVPTEGGIATRATYHPAAEMLCDWTPDGKLLFATSGFAGLGRQLELFTIAASGGLPARMPVPYGADAAISPDGQWIAYTPHTINFRTWKRYRGGMQTDIWLFHLKSHEARRITDWEGTDALPMWHGQTVYYLSDAGANHRLNLWAFDTANNQRRQVTDFADYDVKWPAIGPGPGGQGEIVFQYGPDLNLLDLASGAVTRVDVLIPGDRPRIRPRHADTAGLIASWTLSPTGKRVLFEARGDIYSLPARNGSPRNLTRTSGIAERDAIWSPDARHIAYLSDATGEYELYLAPADGSALPRQLTRDGGAFRFLQSWSPDSAHLLFTDKTGSMFLHTVADNRTRLVDKDLWGNPPRASWSCDSGWLAYTLAGDNRQPAVWLYNVRTEQKTRVTAGMFGDSWPTFDREGNFLYFASNRHVADPLYDDLGTSFIYNQTDTLVAVPLRNDVKSPFIANSDEEPAASQPASVPATSQPASTAASQAASLPSTSPATATAPAAAGDKPPKPVLIDLDGFEARAILLPIRNGAFSHLAVNDKGQLLYVRAPVPGSQDKPSIRLFDPADDKDGKREEKTVLSGVGAFVISADGKKLLVRGEGNAFAVVDAAPDQKMDKTVPTDAMSATVDPRAEWRQIFLEAWRIHRDYFYVPNMHGVDWPRIRDQYARMLDDCVSRDDVTYVIGEMISELNVGHAYVRGRGDVEPEPARSVGMLGCDFELVDGAYRIARLYQGAPWDVDARNPLAEPGLNVHEGDFLLAVNGVPLDPARDPWAAFQGLAGRPVTLTVSSVPRRDASARDIVVKPLDSEADLRYRHWIEQKRAYVDAQTSGRVGYLYVPNTGIDGQNNLFRQFFGQIHKQALIIDERWNGGGQIPTRFIELLNRPITNYWARRDGKDWPWPPDAHQGPKCMLINGLAGSGGDAFPAYFRQAGLGKLIGMRTWGGLVGISGNPSFIDGGNTNVPTFGYYEKDGTWGIEGHGVDPDIEVIDDPSKMVDGGDPQLDAAIVHLLAELEKNPYQPPARPAPPDRSGMGLRAEDR